MSDSIDMGLVIEKYLQLRGQSKEVMETVQPQLDAISSQMRTLETFIKQKALDEGVESFKTPKGTAFLITKKSVQVTEWDKALEFILTTGSYHMLRKDISATAASEYMEQTHTMIPGVGLSTYQGLSVRKPTAAQQAKAAKQGETQ